MGEDIGDRHGQMKDRRRKDTGDQLRKINIPSFKVDARDWTVTSE